MIRTIKRSVSPSTHSAAAHRQLLRQGWLRRRIRRKGFSNRPTSTRQIPQRWQTKPVINIAQQSLAWVLKMPQIMKMRQIAHTIPKCKSRIFIIVQPLIKLIPHPVVAVHIQLCLHQPQPQPRSHLLWRSPAIMPNRNPLKRRQARIKRHGLPLPPSHPAPKLHQPRLIPHRAIRHIYLRMLLHTGRKLASGCTVAIKPRKHPARHDKLIMPRENPRRWPTHSLANENRRRDMKKLIRVQPRNPITMLKCVP